MRNETHISNYQKQKSKMFFVWKNGGEVEVSSEHFHVFLKHVHHLELRLWIFFFQTLNRFWTDMTHVSSGGAVDLWAEGCRFGSCPACSCVEVSLSKTLNPTLLLAVIGWHHCVNVNGWMWLLNISILYLCIYCFNQSKDFIVGGPSAAMHRIILSKKNNYNGKKQYKG